MNIAPAGPRERCSICAATDELIARSVLIRKPEDFRNDIRAQLLVAFTFGVKREALHLCGDCKGRLGQVANVVLGSQG